MSLLLQKMYKRSVRRMCRELPNDMVPAELRKKEEARRMEAELDRMINEAHLKGHLRNLREARDHPEKAERRARKRKGDPEDQRRTIKWTQELRSEILKEVLENPLVLSGSRASQMSCEN